MGKFLDFLMKKFDCDLEITINKGHETPNLYLLHTVQKKERKKRKNYAFLGQKEFYLPHHKK